MTPKDTTDDVLLADIRAGSEEAFLTLYRRRQGGIFRFALQMCGSETVAEDVTQEVFLALAKDSSRFDPQQGSLVGYLFGIARNQVLKRMDRKRLFVPIDGENGEAESSLVSQSDPLGDLTRTETVEMVRQTIKTLPPHYREVVVLCDLEEMSYQDAALALDCAVGTVRSRLHRARAMLLERLGPAAKPDRFPGLSESKRCFA